MNIGILINRILTLAMILAVFGGLYKATAAFKQAAMDTQRHGMVSLSDFNRRLERGR